MQKQTELKHDDFKLLPNDIAVLIRDRWLELAGRTRKDNLHADLCHDRVVASDPCYKITKNDAVQHGDLQIQYLHGGAGATFGLNPPLSTSSWAGTQASRKNANRHENRLVALVERRKKYQSIHSSASTSTKTPADCLPESQESLMKRELKNPFDGSTSRRKPGKLSSSISPTHVPSHNDTPAIQGRWLTTSRSKRRTSRSQASRRSSVSFSSDLPSQAPLMLDSPGRGSWSHEIADIEATDEENVYDLFAPNLR